jgi:diguanylate cyclase (GGDEF)-like protein
MLWLQVRGVPLLDAPGRVYRMIGVSQDITERKRREEEIRFLAYHDLLTGLPNRRLLDDRLQQALYAAQRHGRALAVLLIDLDDFKQVNDSAGHRGGDIVLREVAQRLANCIRKADTLARHGGDEFAIVMSDQRADADCSVVAEKVLRALAQPFEVDGRSFTVGASTGIAVFPSGGTDGDTLLRNADAAMYRAKQLGKNQYRFHG